MQYKYVLVGRAYTFYSLGYKKVNASQFPFLYHLTDAVYFLVTLLQVFTKLLKKSCGNLQIASLNPSIVNHTK